MVSKVDSGNSLARVNEHRVGAREVEQRCESANIFAELVIEHAVANDHIDGSVAVEVACCKGFRCARQEQSRPVLERCVSAIQQDVHAILPRKVIEPADSKIAVAVAIEVACSHCLEGTDVRKCGSTDGAERAIALIGQDLH